jgi:NADPH-dependent 2,4-dienoyl-CoA reductase/sulfur reductase-like enzyme/bacterioferritin-associated ferredoxin
MNRHYDVIIVGSGVAGLAAAEILSRHNRSILVVDENFHTGGQLLRQPPSSSQEGRGLVLDGIKRWGHRFLKRLPDGNVRVLNGAQALGIFPGFVLLAQDADGQVVEYQANTLILATGTRERFLPFAGWTLPGVMSTGAAQILMKSHRVLPGSNIVIGGCTPLMLVLAADILANQGKVRAVLDQSRPFQKAKLLGAASILWPKLIEGVACLIPLIKARTMLRQGMRIVEAHGSNALETVVAAEVDANGRIIQGTERSYAADTLAVGHGFAPNIELPQQAGCDIGFDIGKGGWYAKVDQYMATTTQGIYAAGETTGVAGSGKAFIEGRIAAWSILGNLEDMSRKTFTKNVQPLIRLRERHVHYGRLLNHLCHPPPGAFEDIPEETIVCRCEDITIGDIKRNVAKGLTTVKGIKKATRCGMGNCQGRICGPILFDFLSTCNQQSPDVTGCLRARAPVKTVALGSLSTMSRIRANTKKPSSGNPTAGVRS